WAAAKAFMEMFDPRIHLRLKPGRLQLGMPFTLEWNVPQGSERLTALRLTLECREKAMVVRRYGNKTEITCQNSVCYRAELLAATEPGQMTAGSVSLAAPTGVMHSLNTGRNQLEWYVRVRGQVRNWTGVREEYPLLMLPFARKGEA